MSPIPVNLAIEDELSEAVLRRLLDYVNRDYHVGTAYGRTGYGYLRKTIQGWNAGARSIPFILLTDLDEYPCPPALIQEWLNVPIHPNLIFRVAVREVESWLLADAANIARFLSISRQSIPIRCDDIRDPKRTLVDLARRSRSSEVRDGVVPGPHSTASQGPDYNGVLIRFVKEFWDVDRAGQASPSLEGAINRLRLFNPIW